MLEYLLNISTNVFCQYCPRTRSPPTWTSPEEQVAVKLPGRRPPPHWTGRGPVNEGVMFGQLTVFFFFFFLRSVHGCMGMDV